MHQKHFSDEEFENFPRNGLYLLSLVSIRRVPHIGANIPHDKFGQLVTFFASVVGFREIADKLAVARSSFLALSKKALQSFVSIG